MTSRDSSREIEAIKQRLEAAKSRVVSDSNNVVSAKQMSAKIIESAQSMSDAANKELEEAKAKAKRMKDELDSTKIMARTNIETIQSQLDVSQKEVQEVEKLLAEAEERAAKVDNVKQEKSSNKRRKVPIAGIGIKSEDDYDKETDDEEDLEGRSASVAVKKEEDNAYKDETDKEDENEGETTNQANNTAGINTTANTRHTANTAAAARQSTSNINEIVLEGCGKADVNGTYTTLVGQMHDGVPVYCNGGYVIYRDLRSMGPNNWFISVWHGDVGTIGENDWYGSPKNKNDMTPPTDGWVTTNAPVGPAPSPLKKCGKCGISKKKHSYKAAEWNKRKDNQRTCQVCIKTKAASLAHHCHLEELKEAEEYAKKVSPTPLLDEVDQVLVEGCGNVEINGIYIRSAHNGTAPTYTKRGVWKDKSVTFEIFWDKVNTWFIGLEYRVETWEREILFKHQVMIMGTEKTYPPKNGWKAVAGLYPAPKCRP